MNKENVERIEELVAERLEPKVDTHYKHGDVWHEDPEVSWIWDGWIAEGYFHTLIAMQKVGKSTFLLNLIAELIQRTPSFLNFPLFSEKKYGFVLVGPDMNRRLWGKYGKLAGLLKEDDKGQAVGKSKSNMSLPKKTRSASTVMASNGWWRSPKK